MSVFLSIIIPCFNGEKRIPIILGSIINTYPEYELEVILVDNGSTDGTYKSFKKWCRESDQIHFKYIFYNEQSGPGVARHQGLKCATGKYILFSDDDDIINWKNVALALCEVEKGEKQKNVYFCQASIESESQIRTRYDLEIFKNTKDNILKNFLNNKVDPTVMFNLFNRQFLIDSEIIFRPGFHEDVDFTFEVLSKMESWGVLDISIYRKIDRIGSIINSYTPKHLIGYSAAIQRIGSICSKLKLGFPKSAVVDFAIQSLGSRILRYVNNPSSYNSSTFFNDLLNEINKLNKEIPIKPRLEACNINVEKKRWIRLLALFYQNQSTSSTKDLMLIISKNVKKTWSCFDIQHSVFFAPDQIRTCCKRFHYRGELKGDAVLYADETFMPEHLNVDNIISSKQQLTWDINNGSDSQCLGCPHLKLKEWDPPLSSGIKYLSMEYHSLCNMRCNYCSEKYFGGKKPRYDIVQTIQSCIEGGKLRDPDYIVWGGGEPTFEKNFEKLFSLLGNIDSTRQRVITNAVIFKKSVYDAIIDDKAYVVISIDAGNEKNFAAVRGTKRFPDVIKNLKKYASGAPENVFIKYILQDDNSDLTELQQFVELISQHGLTSCNFQISCNFKSEKVDAEILFSISALDSLLRSANVNYIFWDDLIWQRLPKITQNTLEKLELDLAQSGLKSYFLLPENANDEFYVWGTGAQAELINSKSWFMSQVNIKGYIDPREEISGNKINGVTIITPDKIKSGNARIIIAAAQSSPFIFRQAKEHQLSKSLTTDRIII